jgi:hypothetical protein
VPVTAGPGGNWNHGKNSLVVPIVTKSLNHFNIRIAAKSAPGEFLVGIDIAVQV